MASINSLNVPASNQGNGSSISLKDIMAQMAALTATVNGLVQPTAPAPVPASVAPTAPAPSTRKARKTAPTAPDYAGEMTVHGFRNDYAGMLQFANTVIPVLAKVSGKSKGVHSVTTLR